MKKWFNGDARTGFFLVVIIFGSAIIGFLVAENMRLSSPSGIFTGITPDEAKEVRLLVDRANVVRVALEDSLLVLFDSIAVLTNHTYSLEQDIDKVTNGPFSRIDSIITALNSEVDSLEQHIEWMWDVQLLILGDVMGDIGGLSAANRMRMDTAALNTTSALLYDSCRSIPMRSDTVYNVGVHSHERVF